MNSMKAVLAVAFLIMVALLMMSGITCRDPYDFEPQYDTLLDPPPPPQLINPEEDYVFMALTSPFFIYINFHWTEVSDAGTYTLEIVIDTFPPVHYIIDTTQWTIVIMDSLRFGDYSWRVRAYSPTWKFYTNWSETYRFDLCWQPNGPQLLYPPNNQIVFLDSIPDVIELGWQPVSSAVYYQVLLGEYADTLISTYVNETVYPFFAETTSVFWWQVRAGNPKWQYESKWSNRWYFRVVIR